MARLRLRQSTAYNLQKVCWGSFTHGRNNAYSPVYSWNVNMNNGNVNNNNRNNNNYVLAFSEFEGIQPPPTSYFITEDSVRDAYRKCLENKKSTVSAVTFRVNENENVRCLTREIQNGTYYPTTSIAFLIDQREVFAADFRDRVVHTWCAMRITPLLERQFVPTTWNCRKGKGVQAAIANVRRQIREVSENYTKDAWVFIYDLSGFFMGINREKAATRLCRFVEDRYEGEDKATLLWLLRTVITHAPEADCIRYGTDEEWAKLPERKSLFHHPGLPIGDLLSQLDGNFELDIVDHYINGMCPSDRYVDDTIRISADKRMLLETMPSIRMMLEATCGAKVNPKKYKVVNVKDGFKYLGVVIHGDKAYTSGKTVGKVYSLIHKYNGKIKKRYAQDFINSFNSYMGMMKHYDTLDTRKALFAMISPKWDEFIVKDESYNKINIKRPRRAEIKRALRIQRRYFNNL